MGFSSEEYIDMCDKMMAELNEAEEGYYNLCHSDDKCKDVNCKYLNNCCITGYCDLNQKPVDEVINCKILE